MAEEEIKFIKIAENLYLNGQINQAEEALLNGLKVYPENRAMQYLLQQYQDVTVINITEHIQQENKEMKQTKTRNKTELNELTDKNTEQEDEIKEKNNYIANISFQMRLRALIMELNAAKTYSLKELIANKNDTWKKIHTIESCISIVHTALDSNNSENAENELLKAESLSTELMRKIKSVVKKDVKKEEEKNPEEDIKVPDYRSIVTVRGTKEDVTNCILKAKIAFENGKYDRAENLLWKAERIFPTKNARDLLKQIQAAREPKQNSYPIEIVTEAEEQVNTIKEEESKSECDSVSAVKCMTAFERAFSTGNFEKAERMLNKAKRFDRSLDVEQKLAQVTAAINNKIIEEKRKEKIEEAKRQIKMAGECLYKSIKAYGAGDFVNAEQILLQAKSFDPMLNLNLELSTIRNKLALKRSKQNEDTDKTKPEETVTESDIKFAAEYLYNAKKAYDAGDFKNAERNLNSAKTFDFSLDLESLLSMCRAEIASRSSTEGNKVIPKMVTDTVTTYTIEHIELCNYYFKEAEIAYQNRNLNETTRLLTLANTYHPCTKVNEMLEHVENLKEKKQAMLTHEITASKTEFSFSADEKQEEMDVQIERRRKEMVRKGTSCMKKYDQPEMKKSFEDRENSHVNKKSITNKEKKVLVKCKSGKKGDKEENLKTKLSLEEEEVQNLISMAQKAIYNKKFDEAINVLNTAEELHPTEQAKEMLKTVSEIISSRKETFVYSNCYEFAVEANESDETEALKCIKIAQAAFQESRYDRAEHFLLKSLRIWDNQRAKSFLETVLHAKAQYDTKVNIATENDGNEHVSKQFLHEYNKCIDLTTKAIIEGNLTIAERFLSKAIRINPNDNDRKHLKHIQDVRGLQFTSGEATTSKTATDDDFKREIDAESFINWAVDAMLNNMFYVARHYLEWALEKRPNEETREMLRYVQIDYCNGGHSRPKNDITAEANKLLEKADNFIRIGDLEKAESLLIVSWDMNRSELTTLVHKNFLEARLDLFKRDKANKRDGKKYENSENIFEADKLVTLALEKYKNNKFVEAEELLKKAATFYPSVRINKLLVEIKEVKNKGRGIIKKMYNYACNKLS